MVIVINDFAINLSITFPSPHGIQGLPRKLPSAVLQRFNECLSSGAPTPEEDQKIIAEAIFEWAREFGAIEAWTVSLW